VEKAGFTVHETGSCLPPGGGGSWWRSAAIYQLYVRSFADGSGDGVGDLAGVRSRLAYLAELGVDAIWFNPWYPSPMSDAGYDISDYREIEPVFGALADADALITEGARGLSLFSVVIAAENRDKGDPRPSRACASSQGPCGPPDRQSLGVP
jgi:alpha-glucosidase